MAIKFTDEERELLDAVESTETYEDVMTVCQKIIEFIKESAKTMQPLMMEHAKSDDSDEEYDTEEVEVEEKSTEEENFKKIMDAIKECSDRGEFSLKWCRDLSSSRFLTISNKYIDKLNKLGYFYDDYYNFSYRTNYVIAWGDSIIKEKELSEQRQLELELYIKKESKKWYQIWK